MLANVKLEIGKVYRDRTGIEWEVVSESNHVDWFTTTRVGYGVTKVRSYHYKNGSFSGMPTVDPWDLVEEVKTTVD